MKEKKKIFRGIGIQIDRTRKTLVRRERLVVCIGCIKWTEKNKKKKNCDDAFNVNNFRLRFYVF